MLSVGARYVNVPAFAALVLLVVVFVLLGIGNLVESVAAADALTRVGGWARLLDALTAFYLCASIVLNGVSGRVLLPIPVARAARG